MPKGDPYLKRASDEIWTINAGIFGGHLDQDSEYIEFKTRHEEHISREKFFEILKFDPDIIHFTGHGDPNGILFDDGDPISAAELKNFFSGKNIELIFLNACYSDSQAKELENSSKYIVAIRDEIEEGSAMTFAKDFYKEFKESKDAPQAFFNAMLKDKINYNHKQKLLQKFHPKNEYDKLQQRLKLSVNQLSPFEKTIEKFEIKVIQSKEIPKDLENKIQEVIRIHDESVLIINDPVVLRNELMNISDILLTLMVDGPEYGVDHFVEFNDMINQAQTIQESIKELEIKELIKNKEIERYKQVYEDVIINVFKKIFYNLKVDSIEKIDPVLPEDSDYDFFAEIVGIMYSILKSLNILRGKINQSFLISDKFYKDYLINRFSDFIIHIEFDCNYITQLLMEELELDIDDLKLDDDLTISDYVSTLKSQLRTIQQGKISIMNIKSNLENIFNIEEKLLKLFRIIVVNALESKGKNSFKEKSQKSSEYMKEKSEEIENEIQPEEINYRKELNKAVNKNDKPVQFFKTLNDLLEKMNKIYKICYNKYPYNDEDIGPLKDMYETLILLKYNLTDYSGKYQYLFLEIAELCDFWSFRLGALEKKHSRQNIMEINSYFSERRYEQISSTYDEIKFSDSGGYINNNVRLMNKIGVAYYNLEKYAEANDMFRNILKIDESNTHALFNLGLTLQKLEEKGSHKFEKVINHFRKLIEKDPNHINAHTALAMIYFRNQAYDNALEYIEKSLRLIESPDWRVLLAKGCILSDGYRDYEAAKACFDQSEKLNPNSTLVKLNKYQNMLLNPNSDEKDKLLVNESLNKIHKIVNNFEDRSTKIITIILLLYSNYLYKKSLDSIELIEELLRLITLKDSKLVKWSFKNLESVIGSDEDITNEDKDFLLKIFSIPGPKSVEEIEMIKKGIQSLLNKLEARKIQYLNGEYDNIKINEKVIKYEKDETDPFYLWEISVDTEQFVNISEDKVKKIIFNFDPTFHNPIQKIETKDDVKNCSIKAIGWQETKLEIELEIENSSILKKVITLKI